MTPAERDTPQAAEMLDDQERIALVDYCCGWLTERYGVKRIPVSPEQIFFYDEPMPDLLWDTPAPERLHPPSLLHLLLRSGLAGLLWTLVVAAFAIAWDGQVLIWTFLSIWLLLIFPTVLIFHRRKVAEVEETSSAPALAAGLGMACFNSGLLRWCLHRLADLLLLPALMSYSGAIHIRLERDYAQAHGMTGWTHENTPLHWRRGMTIIDFLEKRMGPEGFSGLLKWG